MKLQTASLSLKPVPLEAQESGSRDSKVQWINAVTVDASPDQALVLLHEAHLLHDWLHFVAAQVSCVAVDFHDHQVRQLRQQIDDLLHQRCFEARRQEEHLHASSLMTTAVTLFCRERGSCLCFNERDTLAPCIVAPYSATSLHASGTAPDSLVDLISFSFLVS